MDTFSGISTVIDPRFTYRSEDVVEALDRACGQLGYPKASRVDQGTELLSRNLDLWAYAHCVTLDFSRLGKPTDNAFIEAFNGRFLAECLNTHGFMMLAEPAESWKLDAETTTRSGPNGAIGNKPPIALMNPGDTASRSP